MKVFVSWSGERSRLLAQALHSWLPLVLHYVKPWLSDADVSAGDRWATVVAKELETSNFGIICVTPENLNSPWVLFEAGALAKAMQGAKVIPLLFNLEFSDISGPLAQFQAKKM
jgi:TIR domain